MIRLEDLRGPLRSQAEKALGVKRGNGSVKGTADNVFRGRCQCGALFDGARGRCNWQAHSDETGHRRFVCDIGPRSVP